MCLGAPIAFCLSPASKVWRKDGTPIIMSTEKTWFAEFRAVGRSMVARRTLYLLPAFFISYFYNGFVSTCASIPLQSNSLRSLLSNKSTKSRKFAFLTML